MTDIKKMTSQELRELQKEYGPTCKDEKCARCDNDESLPTCPGCVEYAAIYEELQRLQRRKDVRKEYKQELKKRFNAIMGNMRVRTQGVVTYALGEVEDFMGTYCETNDPKALTLTPGDHDEFFILTQNAMSVLLELEEHIDTHLGDFV
jgi:hypothetical protein